MPETKGPQIVVSLWIVTAIALVFMALRFFCKHRYSQRFGALDDIVLFVSWICIVLYAALTTLSVHYGLGRHVYEVDPANMPFVFKWMLIGELFGIIAIPLSKTSFSLTLLRITVRKPHKVFIWFIIISTNVIMWTCAFWLVFQCSPPHRLWHPNVPGKCANKNVTTHFALFAGLYSMCADFLLAACPWIIIGHLQMNRKEKFGVIFAMSLGILAGITAAVKVSFLPKVMHLPDPTYGFAGILIWTMVETAITIIAASIPFLRVLVRDSTSAGRASKPTGHSYQLHSTPGKIMSSRVQRRDRGNDDLSDKSILGASDSGTALPSADTGGIMKQQEIHVEWEGSDVELQSRRASQSVGARRP
ncbi:hypothetical protein BCR34DRAFT_605914 [Clohesyomyces aquaticus]|uniref:Rhodopsin domain-containing protein n=1 Tax=Clohesyomyces aquaticus TaxID=1231657 RepID=A0A1Y1YTQ8_9PLEO|nr:hypothetical protein BCR34DRAFT_605914 [Clohesyomyces aquaticus]